MKPTAIYNDPKPEERFGNTQEKMRPGLLDGKPATGGPMVVPPLPPEPEPVKVPEPTPFPKWTDAPK